MEVRMRWTTIYLFRILGENSNNKGEILCDEIIDDVFLKREMIA